MCLTIRRPHARMVLEVPMLSATCQHCGKETLSYPSRPRRFCSKSCAASFRNLTDANPSFHRDITGNKNPMYGHGMSGDANPMFGKTGPLSPRWNGGRKIRRDGYSLVIAPPDHPHPSYVKPSGLAYVLEHRHVMEQHLGRYLEPLEVVHHKDGDPTNNTIENLEIFACQSDHVKMGHPASKQQ